MVQVSLTLEHSISAVLIEEFLLEFNYFIEQTFSISAFPPLMKAISFAFFK